MIKKHIAIVGAGISGLGCAYALKHHPEFAITLYESGDHIGGHSNTVDFNFSIDGKKLPMAWILAS
ncbi:FAD-dependent oxidoreductase [Polynucleobacter necessarius]|uniref:FAD-dependent oxidoreductase n=1 Tax=Polynucleobacter necessarius TaxID=576610 RepID=UPI001E3FD9E8|nr:FAD-dependent oxidoreductase [Polynucleobacter necessarius]